MSSTQVGRPSEQSTGMKAVAAVSGHGGEDARLAHDALSWWAVTPRDRFAAVVAARTFTPVNGLHRAQKAHDYAQPGRPTPVDDRRGRHLRFTRTDTTVCATCPTDPRPLTPTEQAKGVRRCRACRKAGRRTV